MSSRRPPGTPWAPPGPQGAARTLEKATPERSWRPPGAKQKFTGSGRGASRKVLGPFFSILSRPQGDFDLHFGSSWELQGGHFGSTLLKTPKPYFEYLPCENLDFEGSRGPFSSFFRAKLVPKSVFGKKSAQVITKININWLRGALGGAWGRNKTTLENLKRPPGEFLSHFMEKKSNNFLRRGMVWRNARGP